MSTSVPQFISPMDEMTRLTTELKLACVDRDARRVALVMPKLRAAFQRLKSFHYNRPAYVIEMSKRFEALEETARDITEPA